MACKVHQLNPMWNEVRKQSYSRHAIREYNIHKKLAHPRIVRLFDIFQIDDNSLCTVLEFCSGGDLDEHLKRKGSLSVKEAKLLTVQLFEGLKYLHEQREGASIIHYDLKPGNLLFDADGLLKISDFGLSKESEFETGAAELTSIGAGTYWSGPPFFPSPSSPAQVPSP